MSKRKKFLSLIAALMTCGIVGVGVDNSCAAAPPTSYTVEQANEYISKNKSKVNPRWYPTYHITAPCGWINDPNGFSYFNGQYHLFYQHYPYDTKWGPMHWGHVVSDDLAHWKHLPVALAPDQSYDIGYTGGCFSGSAIEKDDKLYLIYTGHVESKDGKERVETQNIAVSSDGINFTKSSKNPILKVPQADDISSVDFRDPKVWQHDGKYYMVVGSKTNDTPSLGQVLLFESDDLESWSYKDIMARSQGNQGFMWECPSFAEVDGQDVLILSPIMSQQGKEVHKSGYMIGKLNYNTGVFEHGDFNLLDYGFDFYAPQMTQTPDGRCLLIGWLDNWDNEMIEKTDGWACMMTVPRELHIKGGKIISTPVAEFESLRQSEKVYENLKLDEVTKLDGISGEVGELIIDTDTDNSFKIKLRGSDKEGTYLIYDKEENIFAINREESGDGLDGIREVKLNPSTKLKIQIFIDKSSVEVFLNDGEAVLSTRIYPKTSSQDIVFIPDGELKINKVAFYHLEKAVN